MGAIVDAGDKRGALAHGEAEDSREELAVGGEVGNLGQAGELVVHLLEVAVSTQSVTLVEIEDSKTVIGLEWETYA